MPIPLLFIGVAAATGGLGIGKSIKAGLDAKEANAVNKNANEIVKEASETLDQQRTACGTSLSRLGEEKVFVINSSISSFLDTFTKIKNVDFHDSEGLEELKKMHLDEFDFEEMKELVSFTGGVAGGAVVGTAGGALAAFGAYGAAQALAVASTGTAISTLSGAAASNATLAFFGGGSLAAGGMGMAGGAAVLGGIVAGPALMVMGFVAGGVAKKNLDKAYTNQAEAVQICEELSKASLQCEAIRRRTYMFYNLLARLDSKFVPFIFSMQDILKNEGDDYSKYSKEAKGTVASCASIAVSIKSVLDTPILSDDGLLTEESEEMIAKSDGMLS